MCCLIIGFLFYIATGAASALVDPKFFLKYRNNFLDQESRLFLGSPIQLTPDEVKVNEIMMHWKWKEIDQAFTNPEHYNFSKHFFAYRNDISRSKVYQIIKKMPKGAALHVHASLMLDIDSLLKLTYEDHLYICYGNNYLRFKFAGTVPSQPCAFDWKVLKDLRNATNNITAFDLELKKYLTLFTEDQRLWNTDINTTWKRFEEVYQTIESLISYRPVREKFFYQALKNFYDDNVLYVEIRSGLFGIHELNGSKHDEMYLASFYEGVAQKFIEDHPDFIGIKLIVTQGRRDIDTVQATLDRSRQLKKEKPDYFAGFDLVGQEDLGKPIKDFFPYLIEAKLGNMDFYFHAGETNWMGTATDENLIDAVLLGTKRIGHGYALMKHPQVVAAVMDKGIAVEVNVISNVVLSLVRDVRNHPLASFLALGLPVVLSSDDPGAWDADPLSHDFYVAFVGVASRHADLRMLKQLAFNSIEYSALKNEGKMKLFNIFEKDGTSLLRKS